MYGRHMKKAPRLLAIRGAAALILVLALSIFPFATVMANTVSANVIDGDQSYTFNMSSTSLEDILAQAEERARKLYQVANEYAEDALGRTEEAVQAALDEVKQSRVRFRTVSSAKMQEQRDRLDGKMDVENGGDSE